MNKKLYNDVCCRCGKIGPILNDINLCQECIKPFEEKIRANERIQIFNEIEKLPIGSARDGKNIMFWLDIKHIKKIKEKYCGD